MTEHSVRLHMFSEVASYSLADDGLVVQSGGVTKRIPYADIESVRLISYASFESTHAQCTIATRSQGKITVRSHHFLSVGEFEDRSPTYAAFVRGLCRSVSAANAKAQFIQGSGGLQIVWIVVLLLAAIGVAVWIAAVYEGAVSAWQALAVVAVLALGAYVGLHGFAGNTVKHFDPMNPPLP